MTVLALTETQEDLWWGAIIGGFVVVLAVAALLTVLVLLVRRIDQRVAENRERRVQRGQNAGQRVVTGREKTHQGIDAGVRQRTLWVGAALCALLHQALQVLLDGLPLSAGLAQDLADGSAV